MAEILGGRRHRKLADHNSLALASELSGGKWVGMALTKGFLCVHDPGIWRRRGYRVADLLANLGWVDFDLGCSTTLIGQQVATVAATSRNQSQPNPGSPGDGPPCRFAKEQARSCFKSGIPDSAKSSKNLFLSRTVS